MRRVIAWAASLLAPAAAVEAPRRESAWADYWTEEEMRAGRRWPWS